ncbi:hypothetical protein ASPWEDRAFT_32515 [Aspergillus wentii DTO 134E9]|uniref:Uncharacterized protein n=1 Tax=Aspergillus wentii DTO 134E9 TaxID=1073089 RepID=A0A1L9R5X8_ASPWE|nr:uncharacterized protein ASPWEDRAFT_32515 [Aspergillus wentii DTO 134E9]OJJ30326.1 hypothetical protein ASPWEDRAFT_32515 [Aspergillus wentii DTO 134E9]
MGVRDAFLTERELQRYLRKQKYPDKLEEKKHHLEDSFRQEQLLPRKRICRQRSLPRQKKSQQHHVLYGLDVDLNRPGEVGGNKLVPEVTFEHAVTSATKGTFAELGDSGSFVFTEGGRVVGLFMGGGGVERKDVFYFSYIEDVFDDIRAVTGAQEIVLFQFDMSQGNVGTDHSG